MVREDESTGLLILPAGFVQLSFQCFVWFNPFWVAPKHPIAA